MFFEFPLTWTENLRHFPTGLILDLVCCKKNEKLSFSGKGLCTSTCRGAILPGSPCSLKLQSKREITAGPRYGKYWGYSLDCTNNVIYEKARRRYMQETKEEPTISCLYLILISRCCCLPLVVCALGWLTPSLVLAPSFFCLLLSRCKVQSTVHTETFDLEMVFEVELKQLMLHTLHWGKRSGLPQIEVKERM